MLQEIVARLKQRHRTIGYPRQAPVLPDRLRGRPRLERARCLRGSDRADCDACARACPTDAILLEAGGVAIDLGRCLFCLDCVAACPAQAIGFTEDYQLAANQRAELVFRGAEAPRARALDDARRALFARSLKLRQVSAGGCNACEADTNVLGTVVFDLGRFGIQLVASPRHADGLLVTGPVSNNMRLALEKTWEALPAPKLVIALGACAVSGGPFVDHPEVHNGAASVVPVDLFIPGCPPHPMTILDGLLRLLGRV